MKNRILKYVLILITAFATVVTKTTAQAELVMNGGYINISGGTSAVPIYLYIQNGANTGINYLNSGGGIISESEYNMVWWNIGAAVATTSYIIPFYYQPSSSYIPLTFTIKTAGVISTSGTIKFSTWHTIADNWTGVVSTTGPPSGVTNMDPAFLPGSPLNTDNSYNIVDRFWVIDATTGYSTKPDPQITFTYLNSTNANSEVSAPNNAIDGTLIGQRFNTATGTWGDYTGLFATPVVTGTTSKVASGSSDITAAGFYRSWTLSGHIDPLPIQLTSFTVECLDDCAFLEWITATESNNDYFTIDKTSDGINFEIAALVKGAGNSSTANNYSAIDYEPLEGVSYYRISQTDFDGLTTHLNTIAYTPCENPESIYAFVKNNSIEIQINSNSMDTYCFTLIDASGQVILTQTNTVSVGMNYFNLMPEVTGGIYILQVTGQEKIYSKKLLLGRF
ncbi:MAG: T9SS type A sorting domain-containing protein [Bacteroidia bacterium]